MKHPEIDGRKPMKICSENDRLFVICFDGTLWTLDVVDLKLPNCVWEKLPNIPSEKEEK